MMRLHTDSILAVSVEGRQVNAMIEDLERQRDRLRSQFAELGDLRPGSLVARYRKLWLDRLPLRAGGGPGTRTELVSDPGGEGQDTNPRHSSPRGGEHAGAGRRISTLPATLEGVCRGQRRVE